ncbi:MAG: hypothetical protein PWP35_2373 [Bacteroidales bacterium]|nr:hypothetical protein [Bacteroidales bacterium]
MCKLLVNNYISDMLYFPLLLFLMVINLGSCLIRPKTATPTTLTSFKGTWIGKQSHDSNRLFYKITFLPENRFRKVSLSVPSWQVEESSGFLSYLNENKYSASTHDFILESLPMQRDSLKLKLWSGDRLPIILKPNLCPLVEKTWELVLKKLTTGDTLRMEEAKRIDIRFRVDNFDIRSLRIAAGLWGYYFVEGDSVYIKPTCSEPALCFLNEGLYLFRVSGDTLYLFDREKEIFIFSRRLF